MSDQKYKQVIYLAKPDKYINECYKESAFQKFYDNALPILKEYCDVEPIGVSDICLRDFFPLQNPWTKELFRYYYNPLYGDKEDTEFYDVCRKYIDKKYKNAKMLPVWMDGGNLISNGKFGICLDTNGTNIAAKADIIEAALGITLIVLPYRLSVPDEDATGHIDGCMQFLGDDVLLVSDPYDPFDSDEIMEREAWLNIINASTECSLKIVYLPNAWGKCERKSVDSAKGVYVNFLETENAIFVPQYNLPTDEKAISIIQTLTSKRVKGIDCEAISERGGSLHCLTADLYCLNND